MTYMKRLAMPPTWPLPRKGSIYVAKPLGKKVFYSLPLNVVIKYLSLAQTSREVKFIINSGHVNVNGSVVRGTRYAVTLFDVVSFPKIKKNYRLVLKNKKLFLHEIGDGEAKIKPAKVVKKTTLKGARFQINLDDGRNILLKEGKENYAVGDTLVFNFEKNSVEGHLKFEKGNLAYLLSRKHLGETAKILDIVGDKALCQVDSEKINAEKKHLLILGKDKPVISLPK